MVLRWMLYDDDTSKPDVNYVTQAQIKYVLELQKSLSRWK